MKRKIEERSERTMESKGDPSRWLSLKKSRLSRVSEREESFVVRVAASHGDLPVAWSFFTVADRAAASLR